jgi:N-sulfoglucosamine sulfohydrolase
MIPPRDDVSRHDSPSFPRRGFLAAAAIGAAQATASLAAQAQTLASGTLPNIVFLFSDDHSVPDLGCYGNPHVRTPVLDRLAAEGMRFEHCYVASPQCSPNRSAVFTGCTPHTTGTSRLHTPMPPWETTVLDLLQQRGYFTGIFRKHHQGPRFQSKLDFYGDAKTPFAAFADKLPAGKPYFLQFGSTDPHRPYRPGAIAEPHDPAKVVVPPYLPDDPEVRADLALYYDYITRFDTECGELLDLLKSRGLLENTLVIMSGDNGLPFPRAKGTLYDPGIQVPMIAWWPGRIAAGGVRQELISHVDYAPTWLQAAGIPIPEKVQGTSFLGLLTGEAYTPREAIYAERNWHDNFDPQRCVRTSRYKLILNADANTGYRPSWDLEDSPSWTAIQRMGRQGGLTAAQAQMLEPSRPVLEFFDLEADPNEFDNVINRPDLQPEVNRLREMLSDWMHQTYDYLPPLYRQAIDGDPTRSRGLVPPAL